MSEIHRFDIQEKIQELLFLNQEQIYSIEDIHKLFYDKYDEFREMDIRKNTRKKIQFIFLKLDDKNENISHIIIDNKDHIIYSNRSKEEIINDFQKKENISDTFVHIPNESIEFIYLKSMKENIDKNSFDFLSDFPDGINNSLHILILNNEFDLIKKLDNLTTVNYNVNTKDGLSCVDLARKSKNMEMFEFFLEKNYFYRLKRFETILESLKEEQYKNHDTILLLKKRSNDLEKRLNNIYTHRIIENCKTIGIIALLCISVKKFIH